MTFAASTDDLRSIRRENCDREIQDLSIAFYESFLAITVFRPELKTQRSAFSQNLGNFLKFEFFDPQDIDLGSQKLHIRKTLSHPTSHKNLVILAIIEAELKLS